MGCIDAPVMQQDIMGGGASMKKRIVVTRGLTFCCVGFFLRFGSDPSVDGPALGKAMQDFFRSQKADAKEFLQGQQSTYPN